MVDAGGELISHEEDVHVVADKRVGVFEGEVVEVLGDITVRTIRDPAV